MIKPKSFLFLFIAFCLCSLHLLAHSQDFKNAIKFQTKIIDKSYDISYVYGGDDIIKQLEGISLRAFLAWISRYSDNKKPPLILNLKRSGTPPVAINTEWTKERIEQEKRRIDDIYYQYPMYFYPQYDDFSVDNLIASTTYIIGISSELHHSSIEVRILSLQPTKSTERTVEFSKILCTYNYQLKIDPEAFDLSDNKEETKNKGKQKMTKEQMAAKELVSDLAEDLYGLTDENGFIEDSIIESFCWRLVDMSINERSSAIFCKKDINNKSIYDLLTW